MGMDDHRPPTAPMLIVTTRAKPPISKDLDHERIARPDP
jgi:hypothetical protein